MKLFDLFKKKEPEEHEVTEETEVTTEIVTDLMQSLPTSRTDILQVLLEQRLIVFNLLGWQNEPKFSAYRSYMENMHMNAIHTIGVVAMAFAVSKEELDEFEEGLAKQGRVCRDTIIPPDDQFGREVC